MKTEIDKATKREMDGFNAILDWTNSMKEPKKSSLKNLRAKLKK